MRATHFRTFIVSCSGEEERWRFHAAEGLRDTANGGRCSVAPLYALHCAAPSSSTIITDSNQQSFSISSIN